MRNFFFWLGDHFSRHAKALDDGHPLLNPDSLDSARDYIPVVVDEHDALASGFVIEHADGGCTLYDVNGDPVAKYGRRRDARRGAIRRGIPLAA